MGAFQGHNSGFSEHFQICRGLVPGVQPVYKFGENGDIDAGVEETVWSQGGVFVPPTTARTHQVKSTDNLADKAAGTGALTVSISGLDANYAFQSETITLNGTTNVPTVSTYTFIHRMRVITAGSGGTNVGVITATADTDATVSCSIPADGRNGSVLAVFMVPAGKTAMISSFEFGVTKGSGANAIIDFSISIDRSIATSGGVKTKENVATIDTDVNPVFKHDGNGIFYLAPEKTIISATALSDTANTKVFSSFSFFLIDDEQLSQSNIDSWG